MAQLDVIQGDSESWSGQVKNRGNAVDIINSVIVFTVKALITDTAYLIQKTSAETTEIEITDAVNGVFVLYLEPEDTESISVGFYPYDVEITFPNGRVKTLVRDFIEIKEDVT